MKRKSFAAILFALLVTATDVGTPKADAASVDFDSLPSGTYVSNELQGLGVIFERSSMFVWDGVYDAIVTPSPPNYITLTPGSEAVIRFVDPANPSSPATTSYLEFDNLGLLYSSGHFGGLDVIARNPSGTIVDSATINPAGPFEARSIFTTRLEGAGIHSIEFTYIYNSNGLPGAAGFDNMRFGDLSPVPAVPGPLPAAGALAMLAWSRRLRRRLQNEAQSGYRVIVP